MNLVVSTSDPFVDNIKDWFVCDERVRNNSDDSHHSHTSVVDLSLRGKSSLEGREDSIGLAVPFSGSFVSRGIRVEEERVGESIGAKGGHKSYEKAVDVGDKDDSTLIGESGFSRDGGKSSPFLKVQEHFGVRDKSVSLGVSGGTHENPSKHSMASVPDLGVDRRSPSVFGKAGVVSLEVGHRFLESIKTGNRLGGNSGLQGNWGHRGEGRSGGNTSQKSESTERRHDSILRFKKCL